jgi:MFS superfamily sulfate permease-like transporter
MFGAWPNFGALSRTAMNNQAGVKTQLSGGITALMVFITIMLLLPVFEPLPKPIMGSIVVYAGYCLFEWHEVEEREHCVWLCFFSSYSRHSLGRILDSHS